jgi:hypothetical protein
MSDYLANMTISLPAGGFSTPEPALFATLVDFDRPVWTFYFLATDETGHRPSPVTLIPSSPDSIFRDAALLGAALLEPEGVAAHWLHYNDHAPRERNDWEGFDSDNGSTYAALEAYVCEIVVSSAGEAEHLRSTQFAPLGSSEAIRFRAPVNSN